MDIAMAESELRPNLWTENSTGEGDAPGPGGKGRLKLDRREVVQRGMNALLHVDLLNPMANLLLGIVKITVVAVIDMFLFKGAHEAFGESILRGATRLGHANGNAMSAQ